ncbi:MAG: hypothetical protein KDC84_00315 [Crocinitomicaceae bacterium]|nr:hypothetical protein [Crocinitomicaceae bacterium]
MKKLTFLFFLLAIVSYVSVSCEDEAPVQTNHFIGTWSSPSSTGGYNSSGYNYWEFTSSGLILYNSSGTTSATYSYDGTNLTISWSDQTTTEVTYQFENNYTNIQLYNSQGSAIDYLTKQ